MATHSLPSQAFHGASVADRLAAVAGRVGRWLQPVARTAEPEDDAVAAARKVREYAHRLQPSDPRMAAELIAAADRHERLHAR
jgi:hypothetical protein